MEVQKVRFFRRNYSKVPSVWGIAFLLIVFGISGCYHKDLETDRADDIVVNVIYSGPEGDFVISKEAIFQANSKSTENGVTHISGYTEYRLSSYDLKTGEQVGRVPLGEMIEEANAVLGISPGKVWMFSINPELGLHCRNPKTLTPIKTWTEFSQMPGLNAFKPARPDWPLIDQYFGVDYESQRIVLTDEAGFKYQMDPETFVLQKTDAEMPDADWDNDPLSGSGQFSNEKSVNLDGDPRAEISYLGNKSGAEISFLFGKFFLDFDQKKAAERKIIKLDSMENRWKSLEDSLKIYSAAHPEATQEVDYIKWSWEQRAIHDHATNLKRDAEYAQRDFENAKRSSSHFSGSFLLSTDDKSVYVHHANLVADTAHTLISRVNLDPNNSWRIVWTTHLPKFYHNSSKADQAGAFEEVYSKGNPEFDYEWAGVSKNYLVFVSQLRMACLDTESGKLLWEKEL
ncbi:MAG: hypothetical protein IPN95_19170 [Bacteroidetes bacterium]|nr:hypothetical protein [Bacteroidota bacterium]